MRANTSGSRSGVRIAAVLSAIALLATVAVTGPLSQPANAAPIIVSDVEGFAIAIDTVNDNPGAHEITLAGDLNFTDVAAMTVQQNLDASAKDVTINGAGHSVYCNADPGYCGSWLVNEVGENGSLTITNVIVSGFWDGAIANYGSDLEVSYSTFENNGKFGAEDDGAVVHGGAIADYTPGTPGVLVTIDHVIFVNNTAYAGNAYGGALYSSGTMEVLDSHFTGNYAYGTAIDAWGGAIAVFEGDLTVRDSTFTDNAAYAGGLPQYGWGGAIHGYASEIGVFESTLQDNDASDDGGAIAVHAGAVLEVGGTVFEENDASTNGGAVSLDGSEAYIDTSTFKGNTGFQGAGAVVVNETSSATISESLFVENSAFRGGAIGVYNASLATIESSTITANSAYEGAAINSSFSDLQLSFVTISGNTPDPVGDSSNGGGQFYLQGTSVGMQGSVVSDVLAGTVNCVMNLGAEFSAAEFNFVDDTSCDLGGGTNTESAAIDPALGPLQFNGGPTDTMAPALESFLVDAIPVASDGVCDSGTDDQRGVERYSGTACDIGAVEALAPLEFDVETIGGTVHVTVHNAMAMPHSPRPYAPDEFPETPMPAGSAFPYGALGLYIEVPDQGGWPVDVEIETPTPTTQLWKLMGGGWDHYAGVRDGNAWSFRLVDGGAGDNDGAGNGAIADPVALGVTAVFAG